MKQFTFDDILITPQYSEVKSRRDIDLTTVAFGRKFTLPVIVAPMDTVVNYEVALATMKAGGLAVLHRFCDVKTQVELFGKFDQNNKPGVAVGLNDENRIIALTKAGANIFFVDIAHGHSKNCLNVKKLIVKHNKNAYIITGSIVGSPATSWAIKNGFYGSRVGIGNGALCTTRIKTGIGMLQGSSIKSASLSRYSIDFDHLIIADGGIDSPGNICKALALGADLVMIGSWFGKTDEAPGKRLLDGTKQLRGMASKEVNDDCLGGLRGWKTAEGVSKYIKTIGSIYDVLHDIEGGLRSCLSYTGAINLDVFKMNANCFIEYVENSALKENNFRI